MNNKELTQELIVEGIFDRIGKTVTSISNRFIGKSEPTMLAPIKQRTSSFPSSKEREITPLPSSSPESKVMYGGTSIIRPEAVRQIWPKKKIELQQKEFFIAALRGEKQAVDYLKSGIKNVLCGNVKLKDENDYSHFDSLVVQFVKNGTLPPVYEKNSKKVYNILYGKNKDHKNDKNDLVALCSNQLNEIKALYKSFLLELGPSTQGLGSYDERFEINTPINQAYEEGLLNLSDNFEDEDKEE